jgi:hypothetical protein
MKSDAFAGVTLHGKIHGGQNPISGAGVYLYEVGSGVYAGPGIAASSDNASISLLNSNVLSQSPQGGRDNNGDYYVTTDSTGSFTITGDYSCTDANSQVYLYAIGGNPGLAQGTNNTAAGLLAGLGSCGSLTSSTYVMINEVSTIATAYGFAGFASDATHVSSSGSALAQQGVANAFAAIQNLETMATGVALATTPIGNGTVPQGEINALANILAACVNSNGAVTGPTNATPCYTLFTNALSGGTTGTQPTDIATAAINIAHNTAIAVENLDGLQTADAPFQPAQICNDFTIAIRYSGEGLCWPATLAIDGSGNIWVANMSCNSISELNTVGVPLSGTSGYTGGGLASPNAIAIDASGNAWIANGGDLSEFNSSGSPLSGPSGFTGGGLDTAEAVAVDVSGNVWAANGGFFGGISEFNSAGMPVSASSYDSEGWTHAYGIAVDAAGNVWASNDWSEDGDVRGFISELSAGGVLISGSGGGGLRGARGIAIDGAGNVWVSSQQCPFYFGGSISEFDSGGDPISPTTGYLAGERGDEVLDEPYSIAIDGSGNVWVGNATNANNIIELVGAATPVVTPIVANLKSPYGQHAVNKP